MYEHAKKDTVLVGSRGGEIFEFSQRNANKPKTLLKSHYDYELNGLAVSSNDDEFATVGRDGVLAIWDSQTR